MDWLTWGFVAVVLIFMAAKLLFERKMYKNSVYKVIYATFTEYRMRKKSIERMAESYQFQEKLGAHKIIFSVVDEKTYNPASFVTVLLESGCYIFGVCAKAPGDNAVTTCKMFYAQNIEAKLKGTVYDPKKLPVTYRLVVPDSMTDAPKRKNVIRREQLFEELQALHGAAKPVYSAEDVEHLFKIIAADVLKKENDSQLGTMLAQDATK